MRGLGVPPVRAAPHSDRDPVSPPQYRGVSAALPPTWSFPSVRVSSPGCVLLSRYPQVLLRAGRSGGAGPARLRSGDATAKPPWARWRRQLLRGEAGTARQPLPLPGLHFPARSGHFPGCQPSTRFTLCPRLPAAVSFQALWESENTARATPHLRAAVLALDASLPSRGRGPRWPFPRCAFSQRVAAGQRGAAFARGFVWLGKMTSCSLGVLSAHPSPGSEPGLFCPGLLSLPIPSVLAWHGLLCWVRSGQAVSDELKISLFWSCL